MIIPGSYLGWIFPDDRLKTCRRAAIGLLILALSIPAHAAVLMEEGFNYPSGTGLAANPPWAGSSGPSVGIVSGSLTQTNLRGTSPPGNKLQIGGGTSRTVYRNFSSSSVTGGAVYFSMLFQCTLTPTNSQFIASLMSAGSTSPNQPDDPLDLYATTASGGYTFRIGHTGNDPVTVNNLSLMTNTTHLIVLKYAFGSGGQVSIYVDPTPGGVEPASANARTELGEGTDASNLQILLFHSPSTAAQGNFYIDTVRIGTNWADVTPPPNPLTLAGPVNQAICSGSSAAFSVTATGTPPFIYQWRTNGQPVPRATNTTYTLINPGASATLENYDVVVNDSFGSITSSVANLLISSNAPSFATQPTNQIILPGATNVTFNATVTGDPPLTFQWFTNGVAIPSATNTSYTITNPGSADAANVIAFAAANPCGTATSTNVSVVFYNQFLTGYDFGADPNGGEDLYLITDNGLNLYVWSSPDPTVPVTSWTLEGKMYEVLLTATNSRYSIAVNPGTSPYYYIFSRTTTGPYTATESLTTLTTADFAIFDVASSNLAINASGIFAFGTPPSITQQPVSETVLTGQNAALNVTVTGDGPGYQWQFNSNNLPGANAPMLGLANLSPTNSGSYCVIITNSIGAVTSSIATIAVVAPPSLTIGTTPPGTFQLNANTVTNLPYVLQVTTNLVNPFWVPVLTNDTGTNGLVSLQTQFAGAPSQFFRLYFPSPFPLPPQLLQQPLSHAALAGQNVMLSANANDPGATCQWLLNNTNLPGATNPTLNLGPVSLTTAGTYSVIVSNPLGSATGTIATITVALPPAIKVAFGPPATFQLNANTITGLTYIVQMSTNLCSRKWFPVQTNSTGSTGSINFQTITGGGPNHYYRLLFP